MKISANEIARIKGLFKEMVKSQYELNNLLHPSWKASLKPEDWNRAIIVELVEAYESTAYKWWKKEEVDTKNIIVECIDILHFDISYMMAKMEYDITEESIDTISYWVSSYLKYDGLVDWFRDIKDIQNYIQRAIFEYSRREFEADGNGEKRYTNILKIFGILHFLGEDFDSIYRTYIVKNTLNKFRYYNGYQDGSYKKMWNKGKDKVEDNVVAFELANTLDLDDTFATKLYEKMEEYYNKM